MIKAYVIAAGDDHCEKIFELLTKLGSKVVRARPEDVLEQLPEDEYDIIAVFSTTQGIFGGKHIHVFDSVSDGTSRRFKVPESLLHYLAGADVSFLAIKKDSVGTDGCASAMTNFHYRDSAGKWHGPKKKRLRREKKDMEPTKSPGVYALS